ncbi:MAG: hypothetical protein HPY53_11800 [Brevinematales bacterium]|nr:hypothetical protein [Brevinematales bacterium]
MQIEFPDYPELDYQTVMNTLSVYKHPRKALSDYLKKGRITRIKKGIYIQKNRNVSLYSREILANMIYGPSYVSFEYALNYWGLIPEGVMEIASATTGKNKLFSTPVGNFRYYHFPNEYYSIGYQHIDIDDQRGFLIASPEKALCDRLFIEKDIFTSVALEEYLFQNLRVDQSEMNKFNPSIIKSISERSVNRTIELLYEILGKGKL